MDMKKWVKDQIDAKAKKPLPVLTFPAAEKMGITCKELIYSPDLQAEAMKYIYDHTDMAAVLGFMDLSVEAEVFGSQIVYSENEVPTVIGSIIDETTNLDDIKVPDPREGRTGVNIEGIRKIAAMIDDKPVIAGNIGPFSLAGRLMDVNNIMLECYINPELVHGTLDMVTNFLIDYTNEYKAAGADGVLMAEPLAGLLSPELTEEFSNAYVKRIVDACQDDSFAVIVHNCGSSVSQTIDGIVQTGAAGFHLGNAIVMSEMMPHIPADVLCFGNVDPAGKFRNGTPELVYEATTDIMKSCAEYPNFIISSGCDIPQLTPWENIDSFFKAVDDFYAGASETYNAEPVVVTNMTHRERFEAALAHKPVDRVPFCSFVAGTNRFLLGVDMKTWSHSANSCARGFNEMSKMFPEEDFSLVAVDFGIECSAWDQKLIFTGNNPAVPDHSAQVVKTADDYGVVETVDARSASRMMMMVDVCESVVKENKGDKPVIAYVFGPLSVLGLLRGQKQMKRDLATHSADIKAAADKIAATLKQYAEMLMDTGIDGIMWDVYSASAGVMDRDTWREVEFEAMQMLAQTVRDKGGINMTHSCQSNPYFDLQIEAIDPSVISFFHPADGCADLAETKKAYGDKVTLMGAVTPWNSVFGTDLEWDNECIENLKALAHGDGYILAPGCFYPAGASLGRIRRMADIARVSPVVLAE